MPMEAMLFWLILFGFLFFNNLIFIKPGQDVLRINARGILSFDSVQRLDFSRQELIWLNPINLLDRRVTTTSQTSPVELQTYRHDSRRLRRFVSATYPLVFLGYAYLFVLFFLMLRSHSTGFEAIVLPLLVTHGVVWLVAMSIAVRMPLDLRLGSLQLAGLAVECLLVPAYLVDLNKILLRHQTVSIGAVPLGIWQQRKCRDPEMAELLAHRLTNRIAELKTKTDIPDELRDLEVLEKCLKR